MKILYKHWLQKWSKKPHHFLALLFLNGLVMPVYASLCVPTSDPVYLGTVSPFDLEKKSYIVKSQSVLTCPSLKVGIVTSDQLKVKVDSSTFVLQGPDNALIQFEIATEENGVSIASGAEYDYQRTYFISFFSQQTEGKIPLFIRTKPVNPENIKPGLYTGIVNVRWYHSLCGFGVLSFCLWNDSPGIERGLLGNIISWGSGIPSTLNIQLRVKKECLIDTHPLNFGQAVFPSDFDIAKGHVEVRCSAGTPYTVGMGDGNHFSGSRRMKKTGSNAFLNYEIYKKSNSKDRWGKSGNERRGGDAFDENLGKNKKIFYFDAAVDPNQPAVPTGKYIDNVVVDVRY